MSTQCFAPFRADVIRLTRLDVCGAAVVGSRSTIVSDGLISVAFKGNVSSGTDVMVKNAAGNIKVSQPGRSVLSKFDLTLTMTGVDPDIYEMLTAQQLVLDAAATPQPVGLRVSETIPNATGFAIETWTEADQGGNCNSSGSQQWGYFLAPYLTNGVIGDITLNDGAMACVITASTKRGSKWGLGPYLVVAGAAAAPSKLLTAIGPIDHMHMQLTTVAPPAAACGAVALTAA